MFKSRMERGEPVNSKVNIINICSLVIGNNLPSSFHWREQPLDNSVDESAQPVMDKTQTAEEKASQNSTPAKAVCPWPRLVYRVLLVGGLALALKLWCGSHGRGEE